MKFESKDEKLFINDKEVLHGWESFSGWYWFATEKCDCEVKDCPNWYGLVQGHEEEWGLFSEEELNNLQPKVWKIPKRNLPHSGRRN